MKILLIFFVILLFGCSTNSKIINSKENEVFSTEMTMKQFIEQLNKYADKSNYPNLNDKK